MFKFVTWSRSHPMTTTKLLGGTCPQQLHPKMPSETYAFYMLEK